MTIDANKHQLVPKHNKLTDTEKNKLLEDYGIDIKSLPKILIDDAVVVSLKAKAGDVIKIDRESKTAKKSVYYRTVIDG